MKAEYDLAKMKSRRNPYAKRLKKQITLRLDPEVIDYFKQKSEESGIPYQIRRTRFLWTRICDNRVPRRTGYDEAVEVG